MKIFLKKSSSLIMRKLAEQFFKNLLALDREEWLFKSKMV